MGTQVTFCVVDAPSAAFVATFLYVSYSMTYINPYRLSEHVHSPTIANPPRTAKSGNDWINAELDVYDIILVPQTQAEFFETNDFSDPTSTAPFVLGFMTDETRD